MALAAGTKLGPYEIESSVGAGGMGEVYRARDTRLDRIVAIKVLPTSITSQSDLGQRLKREALAISKLSHPNICMLHDVGHQDGIDFLVMEYLEGETFEQRLTKGPLPLEQTIRYGAQIAEALTKPHKLGITHRDLKPSNIMLTKSGAKLMDFGLAKQSGPAPLAAALTELTMEQSKLTGEGMLVGTLQYMAPEQLEGKEADARTDIFALGEVMYEMATGKPAFSGKSRASLIAAILTAEPLPMTQLQPLMPPVVERVVKKCLAKDPEERWQSASDLASELKWIAESGSPLGATVAPKSSRHRYWPWIAVTSVLLVVLAVVSVAYFSRRPSQTQVVRFAFPPPEKSAMGTWLAISPDGNTVTFVARSENSKDEIWLRKLDSAEARPLDGTEGALYPFWSPDSKYIGFFADGKLKVISARGGAARVLCEATDARGGTWNEDDVILFVPNWQSGVQRVSATGGEVRPVTTLGQNQSSHRFPNFLPDGKHFLYYVVAPGSIGGLYVGSLEEKENSRLADATSPAYYAEPGLLVYLQGHRLIAVPFNVRNLRLTGEAVSLSDSVQYSPEIYGAAAFSVSMNGNLIFRETKRNGFELGWFDRKGKSLGILGPPDDYSEPALSHDGRTLAIALPADIELINVGTGARSMLTLTGNTYSPVWSPDDKRILFSVKQPGYSDIYEQRIGETGDARLVYHSNATKNLVDWSLDGRYIVWENIEPGSQTQTDIYTMAVDGSQQPQIFANTRFNEDGGRFSPDGRWLAYQSNESGRYEVYIRPFGGPGNKLPISIEGGTEPYWRGDGKEIFYLAPDGTIMASAISSQVGTLQAATPVKLFQTNIAILRDARSHFLPASNGQKFLVVGELPDNVNAPVKVVLNFPEGLKKP